MSQAMRLGLSALVLAGLLLTLNGCNPDISSLSDVTGIDSGDGSDVTNTDGSDTSGDQDGAGIDGGTSNEGLSIQGRIVAPATAKARRSWQAADASFTVAAQSVETREIYSAQTDPNGLFELPIPADEQGHGFVVAILDPNGRPLGPVVLEQSGDEGHIAADLDGPLSLGEVDLPDDPTSAPIQPGKGFNGQDMVAADVTARLDDAGVPVGVPSLGKGALAQGTPSDDPRQALDRDRDGLPDFIDADNDGDGTVDDFDDDAGDDAGVTDGFRLNFFMNLKVAEQDADTFYSGTTADREGAIANTTVITFEVVEDPGHTPAITAVEALEHPGPSYMSSMTVLGTGSLWSDSGYAFDDAGDRFQAFVLPNTTISAGDMFVIQVHFDDGSAQTCWSMINYVFTNIPRLIQYGDSGALTEFAPGSGIQFDGSQDLVLEFQPPTDDTGAYITGLDYFFEIFYIAGTSQLDVDGSATWSSPPAGFDAGRQVYEVSASALGSLSADNTYTVTLPKEMFPDTVTLSDGSTATVTEYKIDIAAQKNGNNAALMIMATKK